MRSRQIKDGLPTRRIEAWHYTDLRRLLTAVPDHDTSANPKPLATLVEGATVLPVLNGVVRGRAPSVEGVTFASLAEKLTDGSFAPALHPRMMTTPSAF